MKYFTSPYHRNTLFVLAVLAFLASPAETANAQTPGGTTLSIQANGSYTFKKRPFVVTSPAVTVTVASLPNFDLHYSVKDSNVIFNDVVKLWLSFKNVGNAAADTVTIQNTLPASGITIVSVSNNGSINGNVITWRKFNYASAAQDSFSIDIKIDTTTVGETILTTSAILSWQNKSMSAAQNLIVGNFARLSISNAATATVIGSGRQIDYRLQLANTGNVKSDSTILVDTISVNGLFVRADVPPTSVSANGRVVTWNLGTLQPISGQRTITLTVQTAANLGNAQLRNAAFARSSTVPLISADVIITPVVPVRPAAMVLTPNSEFIYGALNQDSSQVSASITDTLGNPIPDGVPVTYTTDLGLFYNGTRNISTQTIGGKAEVFLISENVNNIIRKATLTVTAGVLQSGTITKSTSVTMYPGAVRGVVCSSVRVGQDVQQVPYQGAVARVFNNVHQIVGADTTGSDGVFFIALNKQTIMFTLEIFVVDQFGDTSSTSSGMSSDTLFDKKAVKILNTISGRLQYETGNTPIPIQGVDVYLDSLSAGGGAPSAKNTRMSAKTTGAPSPYIYRRIQATRTDGLGRFKFQNLQPAVYQINVDSAAFPNFSGAVIIHDTLTGTFTINMNLLVRPNAAAGISMSSPATVFAGDTIIYWMKYENLGNMYQTTVILQDTLPAYLSLAGQQKGRFKTSTYDTVQHIVRWGMDTMSLAVKDSVWMKAVVAHNIPDSTIILNRAWLSSVQLAPKKSESATIVRSASLLTFKNFVLEGRDTVVAGDSVKFKIWYANTGTDSIRNVRIVDSLLNAGMSILRYKQLTGSSAGKDTTTVDSVLTWNIGSIPPATIDSIIVYMKTNYSLENGRRINSKAFILQAGVTIAAAAVPVFIKGNPQFSTFLQVEKSANKSVAEIGDVVTYQIRVINNSPGLMKALKIIDQLPHAFRYFSKSGRYNGVAIEPQKLGGGSILQWSLASGSRGSLLAGSAGILVYQLVLGADAMESNGLNTAYATGKDTFGTVYVSAPAQKQITVRPGVFTDRGIVIGKIFYDDDRNSYQSEGEIGVKGVEIWMEDGTRIVTGDDGKFSLPDVKPGQHVLRVNERTLPPRTELLKGNRDFAGDATSRFVRLTEGGIARANFFVKRVLKDSVYQKVGKVTKTAAVRRAWPQNVYLREMPNEQHKSNIVEFQVRLNYSGGTWLQRIQIVDELPSGFSYVDGSGTFNGRKVNPVIDGDRLTWRLGRGTSIFEGLLKYNVLVARKEVQVTGLESRSTVELMTSDSVIIQLDTLKTTTSIQKISFLETSFPMDQLVFNTGKSTLRKDALKIFTPIIDLIKKFHYADITIVGFPDIPVKTGAAIGPLTKLAEERAKVALDFLSRRIKLDSVRITACSVFRCDTNKNVLASMMKDGGGKTPTPRHLELRVQDYFLNALNIQDTTSSFSSVAFIRTFPETEKEFVDSLVAIPGDDLIFKYTLFSNPSAAILDARIIDSSAALFTISEHALSLNGIPIISATQFEGTMSSSITPLLKKGQNELRMETKVPFGTPVNRLDHLFYYERVNAFGETSCEESNRVKIYVKGSALPLIDTSERKENEITGTEGVRKPTSSK